MGLLEELEDSDPNEQEDWEVGQFSNRISRLLGEDSDDEDAAEHPPQEPSEPAGLNLDHDRLPDGDKGRP